MFKEFVYKNYLEAPNFISFEEAMKLYEKIIAAAPEEDEGFEKAWDYAIERMTAYSDLRAHWKLIPKDERENDRRTIMHDSVIHALDMLAVYMEQKMDASWRQELGNQRKELAILHVMFL